ncbi:sensor domain-containing phosphodiesterase [Rhizobium sp. SAFR-030]|uniref:sensor domain-containing phosphodiesterase n=1 Tax=Rhizobium sp. SAFR-030 TaxID=3387277 RepID=UPI003F7FE3D8
MLLELQNVVLEMIARGEPLPKTLDKLCRDVELIADDVICSVLAVVGDRLRPLAGPSLPAAYSAALEGIPIGPSVGSCGTAAFLGEAVTVIDLEHDPRWADFKHLALQLNANACWSTPIFSNGRVVATFAFYFRELRGPTTVEQQIVAACVNLCAIAIEREERVRERQRLTYIDALTGLPNRARFNVVLAEQAARQGRWWGVLIADLDNLKLVNDTFGHSSGDGLICIAGERLAAAIPEGRTFRIGGDEFAIVIDGETAIDLEAEASKILATIKEPASCHGHVVVPSVTIGGAIAKQGDTPDQVRQSADIALYHAKERSKGNYVHYNSGMGTAFTRRFRAIRDVGLALAEGRITAHYQPIVRLDTGEVVGFEALCRMMTKNGTIISAANFHEATRDAHVASDLTECMLLKVARDMRDWIDSGLPLQHVGINLAAADFHARNLKERLSRIFGETGVPLKHVILEVTESVYLGHGEHVVADEIRGLRSLGMRVALDDFGTGFASLTHLLTVPIDIIKIDKSFVDRLALEEGAGVIVEGVINIANRLGIKVVAEGIETEEQLERLLSFGCSLGQGYLFSKAVDITAATLLLQHFGQPQTQPSGPIRAERRTSD